MAKKPSMGRQRIKIAKIQKKSHLQVTFSKRRSGLFKKASELSTLCGVEIALIVFSPARKVFSFGHPNVESIIDRFITRNTRPNWNANQFVAHQNASVCDLNCQLTQILNELEAETKRGEMLDKMRKAGQNQFWWEAPIEKLALNELEQLRDSMKELKKSITNEVTKFFGENVNSLPLLGGNELNVCEEFHSKTIYVDNPNPYEHNFSYGHRLF